MRIVSGTLLTALFNKPYKNGREDKKEDGEVTGKDVAVTYFALERGSLVFYRL